MKIGLIELYGAFITTAVRLSYCGQNYEEPIVRWQSSRETKQPKMKGVIKCKQKESEWVSSALIVTDYTRRTNLAQYLGGEKMNNLYTKSDTHNQ